MDSTRYAKYVSEIRHTVEVKESTPQEPILGYTVVAELDTKTEISHDRLRQELTPLGFGTITPPQVEPPTYIQRAIAAWLKELKQSSIPAALIDEEGKSLVRKIKSSNKDMLIFALVKEKIDLAALGLSYLTNLRVFYIRPPKVKEGEPAQPGTLTLTLTPTGATDPMTYVPTTQETTLLQSLQKWVDHYSHHYKSSELSRMITDIIESMGATRMRLSGGVHFVPYSKRDDLIRLKQFIEVQLPTSTGGKNASTLLHVPVFDEANSRTQVSNSAHSAFVQKIDAYEKNMQSFLLAHETVDGRPPRRIKRKYMEERISQYEETKAELELYDMLLGTRRQEIEARVARLEEQALQLIGLYAQTAASQSSEEPTAEEDDDAS
jgi:hypothetical protein